MQNINDLPQNIQQTLNQFIQTTKDACANNLVSVVLFGSAAEGRLRPTSDVNLMLVLKRFDVAQINLLRDQLRVAHAAVRLSVMFILENEITLASEAFAVKFNDILTRHRILLGENPFKNLNVSREATIHRLRQVIVNMTLRLRERYALISAREEQLVPIIADMAGPIRSCAATLLRLDGQNIEHPKEALEQYAKKINFEQFEAVLKSISQARETQSLDPGQATKTVLGLFDFLKTMQDKLASLK